MEGKEFIVGDNKYIYKKSDMLGRGGFGDIYLGKGIGGEQKPVVIKIIPKMHTPILPKMLRGETELVGKLTGEHIVKFYDTYEDKNEIIIVSEHCNGGSLEKVLEEKGKLSEDTALAYLKQIALSFEDLKSLNTEKQLLHRDIKPSNILLHNGKVKLYGFGLARFASIEDYGNLTLAIGTPCYWALEMHEGRDYDSRADVWAAGVVFYEMLFGEYPWKDKSEFLLAKELEALEELQKERPSESILPKLDSLKLDSITPETRDLLDRMLQVDQNDRITWKGILNHPAFFNDETKAQDKAD